MRYNKTSAYSIDSGTHIASVRYVIKLIPETIHDDRLMIDIYDWCVGNDIYMISNRVYINTDEERVAFDLRWM